MFRKPYSIYTAEEFTLDDLFVRWVQHPDDEEVVAYWEAWLANHSHCTETIETARELVLAGSYSRAVGLSNDEISSVWGRIRESLQTMEDVRPLQPDVRAVVGWWYFGRTVAAVLGIALLIGWAVWMQYGPDQSIQTIRTAADQTRRVWLPDSSIMTLHPNSSVRFARQWTDESPRAVWLHGNVDFAVKHRSDTSSARLFRVHTSDLTVEAIGTTFRVRQRPEGTHIVLTSGQVRLLLRQQQSIHLQPGDSVDVTAGTVQNLP